MRAAPQRVRVKPEQEHRVEREGSTVKKDSLQGGEGGKKKEPPRSRKKYKRYFSIVIELFSIEHKCRTFKNANKFKIQLYFC